MEERQSGLNLIHHITDHPKAAGVLALIALAISFSPKIGHWGTWISLAVALALLILFVYQVSRKWKVVIVVGLAGAFGMVFLGAWLTSPDEPIDLQVTFKDSPELTESRRKRTAREMSKLRRYLSDVGFTIPTDLPPIGTVPKISPGGTRSLMSSYGPTLLMDADGFDHTESIDYLYSAYVFGELFHAGIKPSNNTTRDFVESAPRVGGSFVLGTYFAADYSEKINLEAMGRYVHWMTALWQLRSDISRNFVAHSLFYTYKYYDDGPPFDQRTYQFDRYFRERFLRGESAADDNSGHLEEVKQILARNGL